MEKFDYDSKNNILYINTEIIMCDTTGLTFKERTQAIMNYFKLSYEERINLSAYKEEILKEMAKHPHCKISEFSTL